MHRNLHRIYKHLYYTYIQMHVLTQKSYLFAQILNLEIIQSVILVVRVCKYYIYIQIYITKLLWQQRWALWRFCANHWPQLQWIFRKNSFYIKNTKTWKMISIILLSSTYKWYSSIFMHKILYLVYETTEPEKYHLYLQTHYICSKIHTYIFWRSSRVIYTQRVSNFFLYFTANNNFFTNIKQRSWANGEFSYKTRQL